MANICLDSFLEEDKKSVADLDWLDIDPKDYKNMPFDDTPEYIALPKLEQAWNHESDRSNFNLVPNSDLDFNYKVPNMDKIDNQNSQDIDKLLDYTKVQMMAGKKGDSLRELIEKKATPKIIRAAFNHLKVLSEEQGLLGYVYVDPKVFTKCDEGADFVRKRAKTSKYILAMDKCSDCHFNKQNRCEVYKKSITSSVAYDQDLFDFYSKHFSNILGKEVRIASKEDLKRNFTFEKNNEVRMAEYKPILAKDDTTLEKKEELFNKHFKELNEELSNVKSSKIAKEANMLLIQGLIGDEVISALSNKYSRSDMENSSSAISSVIKKQGSLGKVYLDSSLLNFNVCDSHSSKDFFSRYAKDVKYILSSCGDKHCSCKSIPSKKVISNLTEIAKEDWDNTFNAYPNDITSKLRDIYSNDVIKGIRLASIQNSISKKNVSLKEIPEDFSLKASVTSDENIGNVNKEVYFTAKKISFALDKGFPVSKIIKIGKNLGVDDTTINSSILEAFENHVSSVNKYQIDVDINVPKKVKVNTSARDFSLNYEIKYDSKDASVDNMVYDLDLKEASFDSTINFSKYEDISVSELDEFDI